MANVSIPSLPGVTLADADRVIVQDTSGVVTGSASIAELAAYIGAGGVTDHGALTGLGDNDHPQYGLASDLALAEADIATNAADIAGKAPLDLEVLTVSGTTLTYDVAAHRNRILRFTNVAGCTVTINTGSLAAGCQTIFSRAPACPSVAFAGTATGEPATTYTGSSIVDPDSLAALVGIDANTYAIGGALS